MNKIGWVLFLFSLMLLILLGTKLVVCKNEIEQKDYQILVLNEQNKKLREKQNNLDWFESHLDEIDDYIKWKDVLIIKGAENIPPIERTKEELYKERLEVITSAITMADKE